MTNEIVKIKASDYGLEESKAKEIEAMFLPMLSKMTELENEYNDILKEEINPETCQRAKDLRLCYVKVRTGTAEIHKKAKEFYLNGGRFVDGWKNAQLFASGEKEKSLKAIEDHFENQERERFERLRLERLSLLKPYTDVEPLALGHMEQTVFDNLLTGFKVAFEVRIAAEKKAEEDRIRLAEEERLERIRISKENIRLQKEAEEREKQIAAEREKVRKEQEKKEKALKAERETARVEQERRDAELAKEREKAMAEKKALELKAQKEREEREKLEAEIQAKKDAEARAKKAEADRIEKEKKAALKAPDKAKLRGLALTIDAIQLPDVKSDEAKEILASTKGLIAKLTNFIREKSENL